ncbi:Uncharacterized protein APZ42_016739 [Daphnia magna]|uniref:Uncharacterized protein n=1 Tax=Daphnia magna TaxID=35525 RepID=A0A165A415_9CRUS|nr:Uncharacterized protein APZ42_016739 [Daphnia magna]
MKHKVVSKFTLFIFSFDERGVWGVESLCCFSSIFTHCQESLERKTEEKGQVVSPYDGT